MIRSYEKKKVLKIVLKVDPSKPMNMITHKEKKGMKHKVNRDIVIKVF